MQYLLIYLVPVSDMVKSHHCHYETYYYYGWGESCRLKIEPATKLQKGAKFGVANKPVQGAIANAEGKADLFQVGITVESHGTGELFPHLSHPHI